MADPLELDVNQQQLWGLKPDAPLPPAPMPDRTVPGQGPGVPMPSRTPPGQIQGTPAPIEIGEDQRWGVTARPGQTRDAPYALDIAPPPTARPGMPLTQQAVDDAREWDLAKQEEIKALGNTLSLTDYKPLPQAFTREQHPEWNKLQAAEEVLGRIQAADPKQYRLYKPQVDQLRKRVENDVKARDVQMRQTRREQLARDDAPYQTVEARDKTAAAMETHVGSAVTDVLANVGSRDPATQRQADFDLNVSPIMTMSKPKPGSDPKAKPDATNRDYRPIRDAATNIAVHNRNLATDAAVRYTMMLGTPGGGTDEKGNPIQGFNGRYGMGAANYKVIGRDETDNVLVLMADGKRLRVPADTYRNLLTARQQGAQRARQWELDYKKSQEPGMVRRHVIDPLLKMIPEKGF